MILRDMVMTSQLMPPERRRGVLRRQRLEKRLGRVLEVPLTLVQASTGYGKSTELAGLVCMLEDVFWYTINEPDRDPLLFLAHLLAAFDQGSRPWGRPFLRHLEESGGRAVPGSLNTLLNTLTHSLTRDAVLVLDDYHLVADVPEISALVERLIDYRPPRLHVVLSGRQFPAWPALTRWRVKGQVLHLDRTDLAFTVEEIAALFQEQYSLALNPEQAAALASETEGWAIALQMIGQQLQDSGSAHLDEVLAGLPSAMEGLFEYLALEVMARQPEEVQHFLLSTAVLRRMSWPICDVMTGETGSAARLRQLQDSGLFITSVETEEAPGSLGNAPSTLGEAPSTLGVYRYQHLFHDFLQTRLRRDPAHTRELHRKAAAYLQSSGGAEESIYHLLEAGDLDAAAGQVEELGQALLQVGRLDSLTGWIGRLPAAVLDQHPGLHLLLGDVLRLRAQFDEAIGAYQAAERLYNASGDLLGRSRALRSQAQVYLDTIRPLKANSLLEEALRLLEPQVYPAEVAALLEQLAENQLNLGQPLQAQALHQEARLLRAEQDPSDFYLEARALLRTGRLAEAQQLLEAHAEEGSLSIARPQRFHRETPLLLSLVCIMQGEARLAERYAREGLAIGKRLESPFVEAVALMRSGHSLQLSQALPWTAANHQKAAEAYMKAIELVRPFKVTRVQVEPLWGLCRLTGYQGDLAEAMRYALPAIEISEQAGDLWFANLIRTALGASLAMAGQTAPARPWLEDARNGLEQVGDLFGWCAASLWLALNAWWQGDADEAMQTLKALLEVVHERGYEFLLTHATHLGLKDDQAALPLLVEAQRRGLKTSYVNELSGKLGLTGLDYHPGYSLVVRSLGPFEVRRGAAVVTPRDWQREKARQLFQFLLTQRGQWLAREQIVDRLWPHLDLDAAVQNFKVALNALNRALEPARPSGAAAFFVARRENTYMLNPQARLLVDADHFERAAASSHPDELRRALAIYEDDYLADCLGEDWAEAARERLRQIYLGAAERLAEQRLAAGAYDEVLALCGQMLLRDSAWEVAFRLMMRAYAAQGSRAQVQAIYNRCAAVLAEELDVAPSPETRALMEHLTPNPPTPFPEGRGRKSRGLGNFCCETQQKFPKLFYLPSPFQGEGLGVRVRQNVYKIRGVMNTLQVIGLGMASLDILVRGNLAGSGAVEGLAIDGGGMACNAAVAAHTLGAAAGFVGTFGSDRLGRIKLQALRESGVDASRAVLRDAPDDQVVVVQIDPASGERSFHPLAAAWRQPLAPDELDEAYLTQADYLLLDGIHPAAALQAAAWMRAAGKRVMLDANVTHGPPSDEIRALVGRADILICSAGFCQSLTGGPDLREAARQILTGGPQIVVQTDGPRGSDTFTRGDFFHTPAYAVKAVDTSGAGDVFHGAYLVGLLQGWDLRKIAAFSSAAAAIKCTQLGRAGYPTWSETLHWMERG